MVATIEKQGDRYALILDRELVERLRLNDGRSLEVSCEGRTILVRAAEDVVSDEEVRESLDQAHQQYGDMLRHLAE